MKTTKLIKKLLLFPLSYLWESIYRARRAFYEYGILRRSYFKVPVLSVGNLTFGGTGKTPFIIWLTDFFSKQSLTPVVLTRGYKGSLEKGRGVIKSGQTFRSNPVEYGDEPLLISRSMKSGAVIVGKRRSANLRKYFADILPDVILLDDGFQHLELYRGFNIVLFDASLPIERYEVAPLGYLREGLTALKDADAIVISRCDQVSRKQVASLISFLSPHFHPSTPIAKIRYIPIGVFNSYYKKVMDIEELEGRKIIAVAAIASPESFFQLLESLGAQVIEKASFPDHHFFSPEDINELLIKAAYHDAIIMTSEKDMVKLRRISQDSRINSLNIVLDFIDGEDALTSAIKNAISFGQNSKDLGLR